MGLFPSANDFKAGKGVEKDAPRKTGIGRFFELVGRDMNGMFLANLLTCIGFAPVICLVYIGFLQNSLPVMLGSAAVGGLHVLESKIKATPYPYGFEPTMHRYRLNQPERQEEPQTVFVCSMADLFGRWVPTSWIVEVLDACQRAPQHRYLFLTKNPARYLELDQVAILPHAENFWYGSTVANEDAAAAYPMPWANINTFWSMEPLLGPVDMNAAEGLPQWVILGAETGNRRDKVVPRREWVDQIAAFCAENEIPVFYKDNLRAYFPDLPASALPWSDQEGATTEWAAHFMDRFRKQV